MRILVEHGSTDLSNLGDVAMLQVAIGRLRHLWPSAELTVIAGDVGPLAVHVPQAVPLVLEYPAALTRLRRLIRLIEAWLPQSALLGWESMMSRSLPAAYKMKLVSATQAADALVHAGAGVLADPFLPAALRRLDLFEGAIRLGKPTAWFGQGIGPVRSRSLKEALITVFGGANLVTVRDPLSAEILAGLVNRSVSDFQVTGDEALELAFQTRAEHLGTHVGLSLRLARYSGLRPSDAPTLDRLLRPLVPALASAGVIPLAIHPDDRQAVSHWLTRAELGPMAPHHARTVPALLNAIAECRLVVSGSYHGAVLALGEGIPAIGLAGSQYYEAKFSGLAHQFPEDFRMVRLRNQDEGRMLPALVEDFLQRPIGERARLLERVSAQIGEARRAYQRWGHLIDHHIA